MAWCSREVGVRNGRVRVLLLSISIVGVAALPTEAQNSDASEMFTLTPCRLYDSRVTGGPLISGFDRIVNVAGYCGISLDATAITANLTVVTPSDAGTMRVYPGPYPGEITNVVAFGADVSRAGAVVVGLSSAGQLRLLADIPPGAIAHVLLDVSGYFRSLAPLPAWQWRGWEQALQSGSDYSAGGGNPYRDMIVRVRFTNRSTGGSFVQDAFWRGRNRPNDFAVRAALPAAVWDWQLESCTRGTTNCLPDAWTPRSGTVTVYADTQSGVRIWDRGHPHQLRNITALGTTNSALLYADLTPFYWAGDTAWAAPPREISGQRAAWASFLADRRSKGFTTVLLAPAVSWAGGPGRDPLPPASGFSFTQVGSCGTVIPNDCSFPREEYWDQFEQMVSAANAQDLVAVIAGVVDPAGLAAGDAPTNDYPNLENAKDFARYLAARMAGSAVLFSPGFDDPPDGRTQDGVHSMDQILNAVGTALQEAAPRSLRTNHLGGRRTCTDYASFRSSGWMDFYMFHSGHAAVVNGVAGQVCPGRLSTETAPQASMRRAREMPLTLATYTGPRMPSYNGEGPYDAAPSTTHLVDNRYRVRQAGYLSSLSQASGFTYGANELSRWQTPTPAFFGLDSAKDMQKLAARFRDRAGLPAHHEWIDPQNADQATKMVLASNSADLVLAYVPNGSRDNGTADIRITTTELPDLTCPSTGWTFKWFNPTLNSADAPPIECTPGPGRITVKTPPFCAAENPDCDWVLEIQRTSSGTGSGGPAGLAVEKATAPPGPLTIWTEQDDAGGSAVLAVPRGAPVSAAVRIGLSPDVFQQSPRVARLLDGYLVVWHADRADGSLNGVFGRRLDRDGQPVLDETIEGPEIAFKVNSYTEGDQRDPEIDSDATGAAVVVWSSNGQDGEEGGIYGQRFDRKGRPVGPEFAVNEIATGHQTEPQVAVHPAQGFWVAWGTMDAGGRHSALGLRRFGADGQPAAPEVAIPAVVGASIHLRHLEALTLGGARIHWTEEGPASLRVLKQLEFDPAGHPVGPSILVGQALP